jgi:hypothetical protein
MICLVNGNLAREMPAGSNRPLPHIVDHTLEQVKGPHTGLDSCYTQQLSVGRKTSWIEEVSVCSANRDDLELS